MDATRYGFTLSRVVDSGRPCKRKDARAGRDAEATGIVGERDLHGSGLSCTTDLAANLGLYRLFRAFVSVDQYLWPNWRFVPYGLALEVEFPRKVPVDFLRA